MRNWLKQIRESSKQTQQEVADKAKISRPYYTRIEKGEYEIPISTAKRIAAVLGFDWTLFFEPPADTEKSA